MPAGLGGGGWLAICLETTMGTYLPPTTSGTVWVPILSESFKYTEDKYFSPQIRQQTIVSDVKQSYYHIEGDVEMEADPNFLPYFMHCSRHTIAKSGSGPYVYKYTPSSAGSASTAASGNVARTASITIVRNGIGFGYAGCVAGGYSYTLDNGVLKVTFNMLGLSQATPAGLGSPAWIAPDLYGAAAHTVYVDASGTAPAFASSDVNFNGFTFEANFNAAAQNRLVPSRAATYISFGETEATYTTELDFVDKTEYNNFEAATTRAIRMASLNGGTPLASATDGVQIDLNRTAYQTYDIGLAGIGDLIMAGVTGRAIGIAGGDAYAISVKSAVSIA